MERRLSRSSWQVALVKMWGPTGFLDGGEKLGDTPVEAASLTVLCFGVFSALRVFSYVPQIRKVAQDRNGASAISYSTWGLWTCANTATALYAAVNLNDLYLSIVSGIYAVCCVVVIVLTMHKRRQLPVKESGSPITTVTARDADMTIRDSIEVAANALLASRRPPYAFEQELADQVRRKVWNDLKSMLRPRVRTSRKAALA